MFYKYLTKLTWQSVEKYHLGQILLLIFKFFFLDSKRVSMAITMESYVVYIISNPLAKTCIELFFCKQKRIYRGKKAYEELSSLVWSINWGFLSKFMSDIIVLIHTANIILTGSSHPSSQSHIGRLNTCISPCVERSNLRTKTKENIVMWRLKKAITY